MPLARESSMKLVSPLSRVYIVFEISSVSELPFHLSLSLSITLLSGSVSLDKLPSVLTYLRGLYQGSFVVSIDLKDTVSRPYASPAGLLCYWELGY